MEQISFWYSPAGGAAIALLGVAITAAVSSLWAWVNRRWQRADQKRSVAIEKGEQVYSLLKKWRDFNTEWFGHCCLVMEDKIDYNQFLDLVIKSHKDFDSQVDKIDFNIAVHFPELKADWDECVKLVWATSAIENNFKNDYKIGVHTGQPHLQELRTAMMGAHGQLEITLDKLVEATRSRL